MSDVRTRAQEALDDLTASMDGRPEGGVKPLSMAIPAARNALRDLLAENTALIEKLTMPLGPDTHDVEWWRRSAAFWAGQDEMHENEALAAEAKITAALEAMDEGRLWGPARRILSGEDS